MRSHINCILVQTAQVLARPHLRHAIPATTQTRNLPPRRRLPHRDPQRVQHQHQVSPRRRPGPILSRMGAVVRPVGINPPLIRRRRPTVPGVLVKRQQAPVREQVEVAAAQAAQVRPDQQRRLHGRPEGKVRARLGGRQVPVAHLEHVGVVVGVEADGAHLERVHVEDVRDGAPAGADVAAHAPARRRAVAPGGDVGGAPDAEVVEDLAVLPGERVAHAVEALCRLGLAPVVAVRGEPGVLAAAAGAVWADLGPVFLAVDVLVLPFLGDVAVVAV